MRDFRYGSAIRTFFSGILDFGRLASEDRRERLAVFEWPDILLVDGTDKRCFIAFCFSSGFCCDVSYGAQLY